MYEEKYLIDDQFIGKLKGFKLEVDLITSAPLEHKIGEKKIVIKTLTVKQIMTIYPWLVKIKSGDLQKCQSMVESFDFSELNEIIKNNLHPIQSIITEIIGEDLSEIATFEDYFKLLVMIYTRIGNLSFQKSIILTSQIKIIQFLRNW